ncbi:hypothetical protein BHM03_00055411 [Ensete ventricosum]|nr:hypothetical protein BHM03_00055411 [Ensete ventricosum]
MRLNHVELFYPLVAVIGSKSKCCLRGRGDHMHVVCMQRWLATARPPTGAANHGWLPTRGGRLRSGPLQGAVTCKGLPPAASPAASRGDCAGHKGGRHLAGRLSAAMGSRRLRKGIDGDGTVRVKEG